MTDRTEERDIVGIVERAKAIVAHPPTTSYPSMGVAQYVRDVMRGLVAECDRLRAGRAAASEIKEWDGRSVGESDPHAAYCDVALQDSQVEISDKGELIWSYDDALFDKSLAGNGYKIVPITEAGRAADPEAVELARKLIDLNDARPWCDLKPTLFERYGLHLDGVALEVARALLASASSPDGSRADVVEALQEAVDAVIEAGGEDHIMLDSMWLEKAQAALAGGTSDRG